MDVDQNARIEAKSQWNNLACGQLEGDQESLDYYLSVEKDRYEQQYWAHDYFDYESFKDKRVLEIGFGQGTDLAQFAKSGAICSGVDITENHILLAKRNFDLRNLEVDLRSADATRLPFEDNSFDCVYSFGVLHHIPEIDAVISEARRVLKPGGKLMFALYYKWSAFYLIRKILIDGLLRGWLFTKGYAGLLATIETGADGVKIKPYVKMYTKNDVRRLLTTWEVEDVSVHQLVADHFVPRLAGNLICRIPWFEGLLGWYVTCKAIKPA